MASAAVRRQIYTTLVSILDTVVGPHSSAAYKVTKFDKKLIEHELTEFPLVIVNPKSKEQSSPGEMGTLHELWNWDVDIYYLDVTQDDYDTAELRRDFICDTIENTLELNPRLNNLTVQITDAGNRESVFDSNFSGVVFDSSGQDGYYTFVTELYLTVDTQRN